MKLKKIISALVIASTIGFLGAAHAASAFSLFDKTCAVPGASTSSICSTGTSDPISGPHGIIHKVVLVVGTVGSVSAIIIIIVGSLMFTIAGGDAGKIKTARETILYAAIGLVIIASSQTIIIFIIDRVK